jgi:hypothetical protein
MEAGKNLGEGCLREVVFAGPAGEPSPDTFQDRGAKPLDQGRGGFVVAVLHTVNQGGVIQEALAKAGWSSLERGQPRSIRQEGRGRRRIDSSAGWPPSP